MGSGTGHRLVTGLDITQPPRASTLFGQAVTSATSHAAKAPRSPWVIGVVVAVWSVSSA